MRKIKTAFLILRVEELFKKQVEKAASKEGETVSEFTRQALVEKMDG